MVGARVNASSWEETGVADHAPTLASAPDGLSARRVERWLDLPPGAWQRRRLYALRLRGVSFAYLGLRKDDLVIVEPGAREQAGGLVVTRSPSGSSLKRIPLPVPIERRMPTVLELPLRERPTNERVVGTVIGVLRSTGTGALRPVSVGGARLHAKRRPAGLRTNVVAMPARKPTEAVSLDYLAEIQTKWRAWLSASRSAQGMVTPAQGERWDRLEASLSTLCDCLQKTHSPGLRSALSAEAAAVVSAIHFEMGG